MSALRQDSSVYDLQTFKFDFVAAIVIFLVAIPLCLGIAMASGAPMFSGIISGVIGGIVVGCLSGSQVSVSGPAAGMAAVVLTAIAQLGDFNTFLLALVLAGLIQIIIGALKAGFIGEYIPSNVVQGLLCAIGILLIVKQLPFALSLSTTLTEFNKELLDTTQGVSLDPLINLTQHIDMGAVLISLLSVAMLIYFDKTNNKWLKSMPAPIFVVFLGVVINAIYIKVGSGWVQEQANLVNIPVHDSIKALSALIQTPDWSMLTNTNVYLYALIMATVASLESLLNVKASEKIDLLKRHCSKNKELIAQGTGNILSGLIGGIPVTSVILRTSVNIQAGGKTKVASILHGFFILFAVILIPKILNLIPLASLAAILIMTGYKLTKPSIYKNIYEQGHDRFIPFMATVISIIWLDMLNGILIGLVVSLFYILKNNSQVRIDIVQESHPNGVINRIILPQQITFLNKAALFTELDTIPRHAKLIIDAKHTHYIDKEIIELLQEFQEEAKLRQISLNLMGFKEHYDIHDHIDFINVTTYDVQANLTPKDILAILQEGNKRFFTDTRIHRSTKMDIHYTSKTQHPIAVILACIDSRVPVETVFDMSFGDLFCIRVAGNVVNDDILASVEYACHIIGAKLIVVLGHTRCGAIQAACNHIEDTGHINQLLAKIQPAIAEETTITDERNGNNEKFTDKVTALNVKNTMTRLYEDSNVLKNLIDQEKIGIVGAIYNVTTGAVEFK